jgi:hypothetical protein
VKRLVLWNSENIIKPIKDLNDEETEQLSILLDSIERFMYVYYAKNSLCENFLRFQKILNDAKEDKILPALVKDQVQVELQNVLGAIRGYTDITAHTLSEIYGKESLIFEDFKKLKSQAFDSNKSYRFIEALRNYSQHRSVPISSIGFKLLEGSKIVEVLFRKDILLSLPKDKLSKKKKGALDYDFNDNIDVASNLTTMFGQLMQIHARIVAQCYNQECEKGTITAFLEYKKHLPGNGYSLLLADWKFDESETVPVMDITGRPFRFPELEMICNEILDNPLN